MLVMNLLAMSSVPRDRRLYIDLNSRAPSGSSEPLKSVMNSARDASLPNDFLNGASDEFPFAFYPSASDPNAGFAYSYEDLKELIEVLRDSFDMIVIDLPPILLSADTQALVSIADVTVLTALARHSQWGELMSSVSMLDESGVKVISVVLNRVGFVRGGYLRKKLQAYLTLGR